MRLRRLLLRAAMLAGATGLLLGALALTRPWFRNWGATAEEIHRVLPGDEIVSVARGQSTRAITIDAPADRVWGWLAQTGQDRGGFHSFELLEDMVGAEMENLPYLDPALQQWKLGDKLWMAPPHKFGGAGHAVLMVLQPGRVLGFGTRQIGTPLTDPVDGSWTFVVQPQGDRTRLIIRGRAAGGLAPLARAVTAVAFDPTHFMMERRMMEVVKARAEGRPVSEVGDTLKVLLWFAVLGLAVACAAAVLADRQLARRMEVFLAAGVALQFLPLGQPPLWVQAGVFLGLVYAAFGPPGPLIHWIQGSGPTAPRRATAVKGASS
jgi:hypothetical protein